jgi:hypothetical protein
MKRKHCLNFIKLPVIALALTAGTAIAGTETVAAPAPIEPAEDGCISAVLTLAANSHFISYGKDVWQDGSNMSDLAFNPSLEFSFDLPANFTLTLGTWWDVNDKAPIGATNFSSPIGGSIQEIDLWSGLSYTIDKFTIGATYQAWIYGGTTEDIIDVKVAYDTLLSPSLTLHNRVGEGASGGDNGSILVAGLSHTFELGPVSLSTPVNFAYNFDTGYNNGFIGAVPQVSDNGYAYTSVGLQAAYPLEFLGDCYGEWSLISGLTYYWTSGSVIPVNPTNKFLTYNFGLSASF